MSSLRICQSISQERYTKVILLQQSVFQHLRKIFIRITVMYEVGKCSNTTGVNHSRCRDAMESQPSPRNIKIYCKKNIGDGYNLRYHSYVYPRAQQMLMILIDPNLIQKRQIFNKLATLQLFQNQPVDSFQIILSTKC